MAPPSKAEWPFPFNLFQNAKVFYILFAVVMGSSLIVGSLCSMSTQDTGDVVVITQTGTATATETGTATGTPDGSVTPTGTVGPKQYEKAPDMMIDPAASYVAVIKTSKGDIRVQLDAAKAPQTVNSFVFLARDGYYDGVTFHRVIPGFVAQAGDPTGTGAGGPGYTIPDEQNDLKHEAGVIAMAKPGDPATGLPQPNSAGSQWYITYAPQPSLDGNYTVFGKVIAGMDVLAQLTPRDPSQDPNAPAGDEIISIEIEGPPPIATATPTTTATATPSAAPTTSATVSPTATASATPPPTETATPTGTTTPAATATPAAPTSTTTP